MDNGKNKTETAIINGKSQFECQQLRQGRRAKRNCSLRKWRHYTVSSSCLKPFAQTTFQHSRISDFHYTGLQVLLVSPRDHILWLGVCTALRHQVHHRVIETNLRSVICPWRLFALESKDMSLICMETLRVIDFDQIWYFRRSLFLDSYSSTISMVFLKDFTEILNYGHINKVYLNKQCSIWITWGFSEFQYANGHCKFPRGLDSIQYI